MPTILLKRVYQRNLLLVSFFCFATNLSFGQLERNVTIGGGLTTSNNIPFNGNADFGWTSMIFGSAGFHASDLIIKIGFYVNNSPVNYTMQNQRIYMRLTAATDYTSANYPGTAGFTKVFDGPITYNGSGWAMVTLQTPFAYNNAQNLEVLCENGDGSKAAGFPVFRYSDVGANRTVRNFADVTFPTTPGALVTARPNTKFVFPTPSNINCLTNTPATDLCTSAPLISNLNGYCGNTKTTYTVSPSDPSGVAFCGNLENTSWLKFIASETTARLNIIVDNCTDNNGIQMRIYETTNCGSGTFTPKSNCWSPSFVQPGIVEATGLTPGNTYHLMIDGYAGDQCDYIIYINSGVQLALSGTYSKTDLSCPTGNDGAISVYPIGGTKPFKSFALSGSATQTNASGIFTGLAAGTYSVTITDQSNATFVINNINLTAPAQTITVRNDTTICKDANVQLTASGASSYNWTANPADPSLTNPAIASPTVQPTQTTVYSLNAQSSYSRNLIYNGGFELGNTGFASDYTYLSSNPSGDQKAYGIINNANNWSSFFSSSCVANGGAGNMMVVDGSTTANDTVWCQTVPVLPNTNYTFSYLLQSVGINPSARMDVLINGSPIGNFNAPGSLCNWVPVSHGWNSGVATTAKICIIDRETAQLGNDFAIDDIRFTYNATCFFSKNVTITVNNPVVPTFPTYGPFCEGAILTQPLLPSASTNGISGTWNPGALNANTPGSFPYTFTPNAGQCATTTGFTLQVNPKINLTTASTQNTNCNNTPCTYNGKKVVINELHIQPTTGNQIIRRADLNTGGEWLELYNPSPCETLDLGCYMLGNYSTEAGTVFEPAILFLPPGTTIPPLGFLTIGGPSSPATLKPNTLINGLVGNRLYLPGGIFEGGWIGIWDANGSAVDAVYWMDAARNINSATATASFTTSPGTITNANVPFSCPYRGALPTARQLANSSGPITRIGNVAQNGEYQYRSTDGSATWVFNGTTNTANACNSTCATPFTPTCNGTATVTATGGVAPYTYKWSDPSGQTTATATGLCAGTYTVTVKDANNICTQTANITVADNCCTTISNPSAAQTLCAGGDPAAFTATTTATGVNTVKYVYFTSQQSGTAMYTGGTLLGTATPSGGAITYDAGVLGTTGSLPNTAGVYFVYAILNTTPTDPSCRPFAEFRVTVTSPTVPTFNPIAPICSGGTITLPTTSVNGITGTWLPAINNTTTTTYTFTPDAGQCASTAQLTVTVNQPVIPTFNQVAPICSGGTFTLPTTSNNGITGSWLPAINNTATTTYTFTPDAGQCATTAQMTVIVISPNTSLFAQDTIRACGASYTLDAGAGFSSYSWSTGALTQTISVTETGWYKCTVVQNTCSIKDSVFVSLVEADILNKDTTICVGASLDLSLATTITSSILGCQQNSSVNLPSWTSIAPASSYTNILKEGFNYYLRAGNDVLKASSLNGPWNSMNFNTQVGNACAGRMLGFDWSNKLFVSTCHNSLYAYDNGVWKDMGLGGFGCAGNFISRLANGRIIIEKNGFLRDLYISDNNGLSWTNVTNVDNDYFDMIVAPNGNIYACGGANTLSMTGLIMSVNNGSAFSQINSQLGISWCAGFAKDCSGAIYAVADNKIFKSVDGNNWTSHCIIPSIFGVNNYGTGSYLVIASNGDYYLFLARGGSQNGFFISNNKGATWVPITDFPIPLINITNVKEIDNNIIVTTNQGVYARTLTRSQTILWSTGETTPSITVSPTQTTKYYVTVSNGISSCIDSVTVTVNQPVTPAFTQIQPICSGGTFTLPTTSTNGITGSWLPAINNTATTTYSFTPDAGQCAGTTQMTVAVNPIITPVFTQVQPICSGGSFTLPATSNNNITGTWLPAINNTATTTYTFTPTAGQCANTVQMTGTVNPIVTPAFTQVASICNGGTFTLPTTSNNGITGSWLPAINNTATTTYTFTPDAGQCANTVQMIVTVNQPVTPAFTQVSAICSGGSFTLPTTSTNGITGSWLPAINNTTTTTYTFTPDAGQCATTTQMTVAVNQPVTPTFTQVAAICSGGSFTLPTTSNNNITGSWLPAINNTATTTYTFTPAAGQCATITQMSVTVNLGPTLVLTAGNNIQSICEGRSITDITYTFGGSASGASVSGLPAGLTATVSGNSVTISGTPAGATFAAIPYTVTTSGGNCGTATVGGTITVNPLPVVSAGPDRKVELGKTVVLNGTASGSNNNILWTPPTGLSSTNTLTPVATIIQTTTYTLAVTSQFGCTSTDQVLVTLLMPIDIPNVFSPNGDGIHDRWIIRNLEMYDNVRVQIFNRYGSMLFERFTYNSSNAWDGNINGNPAPVGPYYYVITYGEGKKLAGVVSVLR